MRIASIDLGSNSLSLLIAEIINNKIIPLFETTYLIRLAQDLEKNQLLHKEAKQRCFNSFDQIIKLIKKYNVTLCLGVGTAALRNSSDGEEFSKQIFDTYQIPLKIISGDEEAKLTFIASCNEFQKYNKNIIMIDIGGASTEIVSGNLDKINLMISLNIGTVSLTEKFLDNDPPKKNEIHQMELQIKNLLKEKNIKHNNKISYDIGVGVAGTVTTLKAIDLNINKYNSKLIHGSSLKLINISKLKKLLCTKSTLERMELNGVTEKRADIIPAGSILLKLIMENLNLNSIYVNDKGLRWGLVYNFLNENN